MLLNDPIAEMHMLLNSPLAKFHNMLLNGSLLSCICCCMVL